ncbi:MAG: endopeptidase La [Ruminococcaceae bacterium]|nr:endopeptidase La [Oscillospiraceae bacterium]
MENLKTIPVVPLRGLVVFPGMVLHFDAARTKSINAVKAAMDFGGEIFLVTQKDITTEDPRLNDMYRTGVFSKVRQIIGIPESNEIRVIVEGEMRASIKKLHTDSDDFLYATIIPRPEKGFAKSRMEYAKALVRKSRGIFDEYARYTPKIAPDIMLRILNDNTPGAIADYIASVVSLPFPEKQKILDELHPITRLEKVCEVMTAEINVLKLENKIADKVEQAIDDNQREFYLREQIRALSEELGGEGSANEIEEYRSKINSIIHMSSKSRDKLLKECDRLQRMGGASASEATVIRTYLDTVLDLPWDIESKDKLDLKKARRQLDKDHFGLDQVKDRIIELLAVRKLKPDVKGQIICLAGPPGTGKTSIARSLAVAMGREYARVSLGGIRDEAEIRGHRKTYIGSMPGRVINAINEAGTRNPLILFDEIDKMTSDMRGDPASAMLEVLDAEQNKAFVDHYIDVPFDLSDVLFITTANDKSAIPAPLLDRMEVIDLYSYTSEEKFHIAKKHLLPKALAANGVTRTQLKITDKALRDIESKYTREAGVRNLERELHTIARKTALQIVSDKNYSVTVTPKDLHTYLKTPKYADKPKRGDSIGVVNGLAWTAVGGELLEVETSVMVGEKRVELTGSLGEVMKESAQIAVSYIRANSKKFNLEEDFNKRNDIHIHVPEGATPKDGPSAGVTIATSVLSALTKRKVKGSVAMTGEITLTGRVTTIGGLREKSMAAYKSGIKTVIIPKGNVADLDEIDEVVRKAIKFVSVTTLDEVFKEALI